MDSDMGPLPGAITIDDLLTPPIENRKWYRLPKLVGETVRLTWRSGRRELLITGALQLASGLTVTAQVLLARQLLAITLAHESTASVLADVLPLLAALVAIFAVTRYVSAVQAETENILAELVSNYARGQMLDVAGRVDLIQFESASFHDRLQRAANSASIRSMEMVQSLISVIAASARIAGILVAVAVIEPILLAPIILAYVPLWYAVRKNSGDTYRFAFGMTPLERQRDYAQMLLTYRDFAKEVRAFELTGFFRVRFEDLAHKHVTELRKVARQRKRRQLLAGLENSILMALTVGLLLWFYDRHEISLADTGALMAALLQFSGALSLMGSAAGGIYEVSLFLEDYHSFLMLRKGAQPSPPGLTPRPQADQSVNAISPTSLHELVADSVTFTYPGALRSAVVDISLRIGAGEVVALVGENGSGKTTLAKLLAGLYPPESGHIRWNGSDISDYDSSGLRRLVTVLFQDFARYHLTAHENIGLGDHERAGDIAAIRAAARLADVEDLLDSLPAGFETVLGREFFGGLDLSIGQWQRVALARAFFRGAPFIILDEPTASLDAKAELQLFERVRQLFRGRSVLLISHRFMSVRAADRIYVLEAGRIVEQGRHHDLMARDGLYAELFKAQAAAFVSEG